MIRCIVMLAAACSLLVGGEDGAPATLARKGQSPIEVKIVAETLDGVEYLLSGPDGNSIKQNLAADQVGSVEYKDAPDADYRRADLEATSGNHDQAADKFAAMGESARFRWTRELSLVRGARSYLAAKKPDQAVKLLDKLDQAYPRSIHAPAAADLRVDVALARGDMAAADAAVKRLRANVGAWGAKTEVTAMLAEARVHQAAKRDAEAVTATQAAFKKMSSDDDRYGAVGIALAQAQLAAKRNDDALATFSGLVYAPVGGAAQAEAHLGLAKILDARGGADLIRALDHALLARVLRGAPTGAKKSAEALARAIVEKLAKDPSLAEDVKEYRGYLAGLR